jgi:hypothetical protein
MILRLALINCPTKVGPAAWEKCFAETADRADLFGINEAHSPRQKATYRRLAKARGLRRFGLLRTPNPVFNDPHEWRRTSASIYRLHGTGPLVARWPGFNATRYATAAVFTYVGPILHAAPQLTVINSHWVPRGPKVPEWWRARARRRSIAVVSKLIRRHLAAGRVVVVLGDLNMTHAPDLPGVAWVHDRSVDKIGVACPEGWEITGGGSHAYRAPTDHKTGVCASVWLAPRRRTT